MKATKHFLFLIACLLLPVCARATDDDAELQKKQQTSFQTYKEMMKKDPSLIRLYTFEEGQGEKIANHVQLDAVQIALTGGPLGSLTIQRFSPYGAMGDHSYPDTINPAWTQGRWPWKAALTSGVDSANVAWGATKIYRSGITGAEFAEGGSFCGWVRPHTSDVEEELCNLITLGDGWGQGFVLFYQKAKWAKQGRLTLKIAGEKETETIRTSVAANEFTPGVWHHVAFTIGHGKVSLYVDGSLAEEKEFAATLIPTEYKDYPLVGPFYENSSPTRFGSFLMIANNPQRQNTITARFDIGELSIYNRTLAANEISNQYDAGKPADTAVQQLATYNKLQEEKAFLDKISMSVPVESDGYFRIDEPVVATISADTEIQNKIQGSIKAIFQIETLYGKPVQTIEKTFTPSTPLIEKLSFPACDIYYLDMTLYNPDGSVLKQLDEKYCIGIVPPAPKELSADNPIAYWADTESDFCYDAPVRRLSCYSFDSFKEKFYDPYMKRIPNFRGYIWFGGHISLKPEDKEFNRKLFEEFAEFVKDDTHIFGIELTSEPHTTDIPAYVEMLRMAKEIIGKNRPDILFFPPGGAPPSIPMIAEILKQGGIKYVDGVSYHPYSANPIASHLWDNPTIRLKEVTANYPDKKLSLWNTESGLCSLPRINYRPMTRKDAHAARMPSGEVHGHQFFHYFISLRPENEAAAMQCHDALLKLLDGYKIYTLCQNPDLDGNPGMRGIALTALAGQILNTQKSVTQLKLSSVENMCLLIKNADNSTTAALFSMDPATVNFKVAPNATFKTMDMLGNYSSINATDAGLLTIEISKHPFYIFNIPDSLQEVVPLKLSVPEELPENRILRGNLTVTNPFPTPLSGTLRATEIRGANISLSKTKLTLEPGKVENIEVVLQAEFLKRRPYLLAIDWKNKSGKNISSTQSIFVSKGVLQLMPQLKQAVNLDGNDAEWAGVPEAFCDDADSVVHGKPNYAEMWVPQWTGKDDLAVSIKTAWRKNDGIYFFLRVKDNVVLPAPSDKTGIAFKYDCLEFFIDTRSANELGTVLTPGADQVVVMPKATGTAETCALWYAKKDNSHVTVQCVGRKTTDGYVIEGKVAPNDKSDFRVAAGSQLMMDFLIDDTDSLDEKLLRKSAMALHGGMNNSINSNIWGRYELSLDEK